MARANPMQESVVVDFQDFVRQSATTADIEAHARQVGGIPDHAQLAWIQVLSTGEHEYVFKWLGGQR